MSDLLQKIKNLTYKVRMFKTSYGRDIINPERDWKIILLSSFILLCLGAISAYYFYIEVDSGKFFIITRENAEKEFKLDTNLLKKTIEDINLRQTTYNKVNDSRVVPKEPSS